MEKKVLNVEEYVLLFLCFEVFRFRDVRDGILIYISSFILLLVNFRWDFVEILGDFER